MIRKIEGTSLSWNNFEYEWCLYIGTPSDIKAMYRSLLKASEKRNTWLTPVFVDFPISNFNRDCYGIMVDYREYTFTVVNQATIVDLILEGYKVK